MSNKIQNYLRELPSVNELLHDQRLKKLIQEVGKQTVKDIIREVLIKQRKAILKGEVVQENIQLIVKKIYREYWKRSQKKLKPVVNATGVILHTNLGRSLLSPLLKKYINQIMFSYSNLEYDLLNKKRGLRYRHVEQILKELTNAEDVLVVNNNAAAVMLVLDTLVPKKDVIISRGELVEIGGSFRIPEIIIKGGGNLKEVGTTNKTHLKDYQKAINEQTGAILKVHTSNYRIVGFTEKPRASELYKLAQKVGVPLINDLGSGLFIDLSEYGLPKEPLIQDAVASSDIVTFSGDKLLGGPQAGIIVGKTSLVEKIKKNQLLRALRVDKITLAALESTLLLYRDSKKALSQIPTLRMIVLNKRELRRRAEKLAKRLNLIRTISARVEKGFSQVGGGSFPGYLIPTSLVILDVNGTHYSANKFDYFLRTGEKPIITRLDQGHIVIDVRTLQEGDDNLICNRITEIIKDSKYM